MYGVSSDTRRTHILHFDTHSDKQYMKWKMLTQSHKYSAYFVKYQNVLFVRFKRVFEGGGGVWGEGGGLGGRDRRRSQIGTFGPLNNPAVTAH